MSDFNDFGFSTVSEDEYRAQQTTQVDTAKEVASTATASLQPELDKIESKISSLTDSMRVMQDDLEVRKEELKDKKDLYDKFLKIVENKVLKLKEHNGKP